MYRMTHERANGIKTGYWSPNKKEDLVQRLAAYENTGLEPGEVHKLIESRRWIPVEERLPEKNEYFVETSGDKDFPNGYYKRLEIAYVTDTIEYVHGYYDGYKWMGKYLDTIKNVVAWRIHEPYRPERKDNHDCK